MSAGNLKNYPEISFVENMSVEEIQNYYMDRMTEKYEELTGKKLFLAASDPVRLIAYADCLLLYQLVQYADRAGKMSLLKYSFGDYLENLGALKGIRRQNGAKAVTRLRFTMSAARPNVTVVPAGTRVTASDGVYFQTLEVLEIPQGVLTGEVNAACKDVGMQGNGYKPGDLNILVDPVAYIRAVENLTETMGGADVESDESLAERIYLAPSSFSVAGPNDAYAYWVKTYDTGIADVYVDSPKPGDVDIRFILQDGKLPDETMIEELQKFLEDGNIRPLTDHVTVQAPDIEEYEIDLTYYVNESDRMQTVSIMEQVGKAVDAYQKWQCGKVGRDINPDKLRTLIIQAGAKRVEIRSPEYRPITHTSVPVQTGETVTYGGIEDD